MNRLASLLLVVCVLAVGLYAASAARAELPKPLVTGMKNPESVVVAPGGRIYVSVIGEFNQDGDGSVVHIDGDRAVPFATGLNDPKGLAAFGPYLFVTDKDRVLRIDGKGKVDVLAAASAFPSKPQFLNDIISDEKGILYVGDSGDRNGGGGAVYRIDQKGKVTTVADAKTAPELKNPNGLLLHTHMHLLVLDLFNGTLNHLKVDDGTIEKVADGFGRGDGLAWDMHGRLFVSDWAGGKVYGIAQPGEKRVLLAEGFQSAADLCYDAANGRLLVPDMKAGTLTALPAVIPGWEVDEREMTVGTEIAFPDLEWTGWEGEVNGKVVPLRPIVLTHAGDGSNRVFVATQHGVIHVFDNDQEAKKTKVFLDIQDQVYYNDRENEQGFLGLAFHPNFKQNGEFYCFHTIKRLTNVISRFKVSKDDPNRADPASQEIIFSVDHKYWNHDGGTVIFGPDGYLYVVLGDGGSANDPDDNGQNLGTVLGKVLRIDVNRREGNRKYGIPKDNPFVDTKGAQPEIWCYGVRNPWRIAFDPETNHLWCGEVGQNLWEEINLLTKGGNYGWNRRESFHPFGPKGTGPSEKYIDPIWEYHHDLGKSITGGTVYRGKRVPELAGYYLYADYVSNKHWALKYDKAKGRVTENRPIASPNVPVLSYGEDEQGDVYFMTYTPTGQGIYRFTSETPKQ